MPKNSNAPARKNTRLKAAPGLSDVPSEALEAECRLLREDIAQLQARLEQRVLDAALGQSAAEAAQNRQTLTEERGANREAVLGAGLLALAAQRDELAGQVTQMKADLEAAEADRAAARAEIKTIHNSRSWKIARLMRGGRPGLNRR